MVQARQIYAFAVSARHGWHPRAHDLAESAFVSMVRDFHRTGGTDGWAFSIDRFGAVVDGTRDLYAHAFVLLAIAFHAELTGDMGGLALADETLDHLDRNMRSAVGGYCESLPATSSLRRQNPHMHLFEALLALWRVSSEERYLERARQLFELFRAHFFQPQHGVVGEYYDEDLKPTADSAGQIVEPGHHYEWIWLLRKFEAACGDDMQLYVDALYAHANRHGYDADGLVVDELMADGRLHTPSRRIWPITEAIKANAIEAARGRDGAAAKVKSLVGLLRDRFLAQPPAGGWIDRLDARGRAAAEFMPASTLYHLVGALDVLEAVSSEAC